MKHYTVTLVTTAIGENDQAAEARVIEELSAIHGFDFQIIEVEEYEPSGPPVRPDGPETARGGLIGQGDY